MIDGKLFIFGDEMTIFECLRIVGRVPIDAASLKGIISLSQVK